MKISIDGSGNVSLDTSYDSTGINTINSNMVSMLNTLKTFDSDQINGLKNELNSLYPTLINWTEFINEWQDVKGEVEL